MSQTPISDSPPNDGLVHGRREGGDSSASSAMEATEDMLVQEPDAEVDAMDGDQGSVSGRVESRSADEESKKNLREQLRRTLNKKESYGG